MLDLSANSVVKNFFVPHFLGTQVPGADFGSARVCALVPTYNPGEMTIKLVRDLLRWNPNIYIYVIDDSTPLDYEPLERIKTTIASFSEQVTVLRTPTNKLKAGAINYGIARLIKSNTTPDILFTLDDDVVIEEETIANMVEQLTADERLGAVCSQSRVLNKNDNIITRLQGLEYIGFNASRLADEGFFYGPLVMHGMLTAFRFSAIREIGGFMENHLIEDYEMTTRLKEHGWHVRLAPNALAWTEVPASFSALWKQRTRWIYGGITILERTSFWPSIVQDILGHGMFITTLMLILFYFFVFDTADVVPPTISQAIIVLSLINVVIWYTFQLWFMRFYDERDWKDWLIRITLLPEFLYAQIMTCVLLGGYLFLIFNSLCRLFPKAHDSALQTTLRRGFSHLGYTSSWGTR